MDRDVVFRYKETRINLDSTASVEIRVPPSRNGSRTRREASEDERAWKAKNLATASSLYRRKHHGSPRTILWRVLEDDTVLSLRAGDVSRRQHEADAPLTINLRFASPLRTPCIGFADPAEHDALTVFAVDEANHLYSISLRADAFRRRSAIESGFGESCRPYAPPGFGFKHPHRLVAVSSDQLIVTMHDGGILKFERGGEETIYNVAGWGQSLRGLVPFQRSQTIRHDKINMELTAATSAAVTSMGHADTSFLFTVCLDHRMRVWDVRSGQILYTGDLLNAPRDAHEVGKWTIDPSHSSLVRLVDTAYGQAMAVTLSPLGAGEFKFWRVKANGQGSSILVADLFPDHHLVPPPPPSSSDVWTLADFGAASRPSGPELWTLWKNNTTYRVQTLRLRPRDRADPWSDGWKAVRVDTAMSYAQTPSPADPADSAERWLAEIFYPGRFPRPTLETALAIYEKGVVGRQESGASSSLAQSICSVVGSLSALESSGSGTADYEKFRANSEVHWRRFYRLLGELDRQRGEALSLVLDPNGEGTAWVVCADCLACVRHCSPLELVCHNLSAPEKNSEDVAALVGAGLTFVESFSDATWQLTNATLRSQLEEDSGGALTDEERLQFFADRAGFWRQLAEEDCAAVVDSLGTGFRTVTPRLYDDLFDLVTADTDENMRELRHAFTGLGTGLAVRTVQDTAELHWQVLFTQLVLLVHMESELDADDPDALHGRVDVGYIYCRLLDALRRLELVRWMGKTEGPSTEGPSTALEALLGHLLGLPEPDTTIPLSSSITQVATNLCAADSDVELVPHLHQCFFLRAGRPDLALELAPFAAQDPFSVYVQGRVWLALDDCDKAAVCFRRAAVGLSISIKHVERHSARLLDDTEWNMFNSGLPRYYAHIVALLDRQKAYSHVVDFARLALQFAGSDSDSVRMDMLSRLFIASTAVSRFDVAHSALLAMRPDEALQRSYLRRLVDRMCESGRSGELVGLPFAGLQDAVDAILLERCSSRESDAVPYHQILYAWRISRNEHRGAAAVLLGRLRSLRRLGEGDRVGGDTLDTQVTRQYLLLINALSCLDPKEAFILEEEEEETQDKDRLDLFEDAKAVVDASGAEPDPRMDQLAKLASGKDGRRSVDEHASPRKVVTLGDVRKQYQEELDRIVAIQNDQYAYSPVDEMELG